jgi:undecaprenyl-diphosphatase
MPGAQRSVSSVRDEDGGVAEGGVAEVGVAEGGVAEVGVAEVGTGSRSILFMNRLDETVDDAFEPLRGRPQVDRAAALVSNLADYGFVWVVLAAIKGRRRGAGRRRAVVSLAAAGFSSMAVVRATKSVVVRPRPEDQLDVRVRTPTSNSFPSGHTLAAFATAFVLADSPAETAAYVGFAGAVATSRVHLRAHHPSDVVGGAAVGSVLGLVLRPIVDRVTPGRARPTWRKAKGMGPEGYVLKRL